MLTFCMPRGWDGLLLVLGFGDWFVFIFLVDSLLVSSLLTSSQYIYGPDFQAEAELVEEEEIQKSAPATLPNRPFVCTLCGCAYVHRASLYRHQKYECRGGPTMRFSCTICSSSFKRKDHLISHIKNLHVQAIYAGTATLPDGIPSPWPTKAAKPPNGGASPVKSASWVKPPEETNKPGNSPTVKATWVKPPEEDPPPMTITADVSL